jgi:hypothetical protein
MAQSSAYNSVQLVALALPAVALYLSLLATLFSETEEVAGLEPTGVVVLSKADSKPPFAWGLGCLFAFLMSAIFLVGGLVLSFEPLMILASVLVILGNVLLIVALILFAVSVALLLENTVLPQISDE